MGDCLKGLAQHHREAIDWQYACEQVKDPRRKQGTRFSITSIVLLALAAILEFSAGNAHNGLIVMFPHANNMTSRTLSVLHTARSTVQERSGYFSESPKCELDTTALKRARVFVDSRETAAANGDVHSALQTGKYTLAEVSVEIGEVLAGQKPGRISQSDITIVKCVGLGVQDLVAAEVSLKKLAIL